MPIYAYKCSACGHAQDVLQKMSDPILTVCPECNQEAYVKQVTAAGFRLKGSGWYVTDFRDGGQKPSDAAASSGSAGTAAQTGAGAGSATDTAPAAKPAESSAGAASSPAASS